MTHRQVLNRINLPRHILINTVGKNHPKWLRLVLGTGIMVLAETIPDATIVLRSLAGLIHAVGAVPWIDAVTEISIEKEEQIKCETC